MIPVFKYLKCCPAEQGLSVITAAPEDKTKTLGEGKGQF
jgi:hypothetical protein